MKQKKDWTDGLRDRMKGAQMTPPDGEWARLEKELGGTGGHSPVSVPWKRVAVWTAAAAAVLAVVFFAIPDSEQASPLTSNQSPLLQERTGEATDDKTSDLRLQTSDNSKATGEDCKSLYSTRPDCKSART